MKKQPSPLPRRRMLQLSLGATAGILTTAAGCNTSTGETAQSGGTSASCDVTPDQTLGPFYPHVKNGDGDVDLTTIQGKEGQAQGQVIRIRGRILDENCQPVEKALVEVWQANHAGRYSHEGDTENPIPLDPHFEGWGEMATDANGDYAFKTIKPGAYSFGDPSIIENWRTPHIHFKVSRRGYHEIVTQMYFEGEALNATDTVIQELPEGERAPFILASGQQEDNIPVFNFNLTLKKVATSKERLAAIDACTGKYEMSLPLRPPNEEVVIHREAQRLFLDLPGYATVELKPQGQDDFLATSVNCRLVFNRNEEGSVNSVTIHSILKSDKKAPVVAPKTA
ncbi:MAG: protocatechuate 3,4-dioxygenase [Phaeodactylibacter sp.]|uniref:protocatechuate 3,4-dioxygenase n=1 Tax=Phaeodactylibacter sp. TaxID=1940289 RepID=UPI0032ED7395